MFKMWFLTFAVAHSHIFVKTCFLYLYLFYILYIYIGKMIKNFEVEAKDITV